MIKRLWFELNKPRKFYDFTNLIGYAIIAFMVVSLNKLAYRTGEFVGTRDTQREAVEHHCGMWDVFHNVSPDGRWFWRDEWEKMCGGIYPWEVSPEVLEKLRKQHELELQKNK